MVSVVTFIGKIEGLKAASLHAQYFEEYLMLSSYVDDLKIVTDTVNIPPHELALPKNVRIVKVPAVSVPKVYGASKIAFYSIAPLMVNKDPGVLYVRTFSPPELSAIPTGKMLKGIPAVLVIPGTWLFGKPSEERGKERLYKWFLRRAMDAADRIVLYSKLMLPEILIYHPRVDTDKFVYLHNAVNVKRFAPDGPIDQDIARLKGPKICALYVGRINEKKGVGDLVMAFEKVVRRGIDAILILVGDGPKEYLTRIKEMVVKLGLDARVILLGGVPNERMPAVLRTVDVFLYATREGEGIPRAILEAMACGKPVIATRVAGIPEAVVHGRTGYLVDPKDVDALAERLYELTSNRALAEEMGSQGRKLVEMEFSYDVVIPKLARLLEEVAQKGK